jgi:hypothetical protein
VTRAGTVPRRPLLGAVPPVTPAGRALLRRPAVTRAALGRTSLPLSLPLPMALARALSRTLAPGAVSMARALAGPATLPARPAAASA